MCQLIVIFFWWRRDDPGFGRPPGLAWVAMEYPAARQRVSRGKTAHRPWWPSHRMGTGMATPECIVQAARRCSKLAGIANAAQRNARAVCRNDTPEQRMTPHQNALSTGL